MRDATGGIRVDVSRGPNWLFLRLDPCESDAGGSLLEQVWAIVSKHFVYRVVLEFGPGFDALSRETIEQLDKLRHRLESHDGALRVCGLDSKCAQRLQTHCSESKLRSRLVSHATLAAAVLGDESADTRLPGAERTSDDSETITQDIAYEALRAH